MDEAEKMRANYPECTVFEAKENLALRACEKSLFLPSFSRLSLLCHRLQSVVRPQKNS